MTVCIAAICTDYALDGAQSPVVVGASDRRLTLNDWTYEPPIWKRLDLAPQIVAMTAGNAAASAAMYEETRSWLAQNQTPHVKLAAEAWASAFAEYRRREAERSILAPLGLDLTTYRQEEREARVRLEDQLTRWQLDDEAIIAGLDPSGAHLYAVRDPGWASCEDQVCFAAIGSGSGHAAAEFMRAKYTWTFSVARALLLIYRAKKSSEVDPFVGSDTDLFVIGPGQDVHGPVNDALVELIAKVHDKTLRGQAAAFEEADKAIEKQVAVFIQERTQQTVEQDGASSDGEQSRRGGSEKAQETKD